MADILSESEAVSYHVPRDQADANIADVLDQDRLRGGNRPDRPNLASQKKNTTNEKKSHAPGQPLRHRQF